MATYVNAFIFYTLAMIGIMLIGFIVYKKTFMVDKSENKGTIKILDSIPIGNKKMLMVVKVKNEKFLIASGLEHTTFLSKLENEDTSIQTKKQIQKEYVHEPKTYIAPKENYMEDIKPQPRFNNAQPNRISEAQRQFKELYEQEEIAAAQINTITNNKKEKIKQLLKELQQEESMKYGSRF